MFVIKGLLDRVCFAVGVLLFMQVPHFVDQYTQYLCDYYQVQMGHLDQYQQIANKQYQGDLDALIEDFESNARVSVQQAGNNIRKIRDESISLQSDIDVLESNQFVFKLAHLAIGVHYGVAKETVRIYKPSIPISIEGFICGLIGGVFLSLFFNLFFQFPRLFRRKEKKSINAVAQRIEPTMTRAKRD